MRINSLTLAFVSLSLFTAAALPAAGQVNLGTVPVGLSAFTLAANPATNKIYVANFCGTDPNCDPTSPGTVTVINGLTDETKTVTVGVHDQFLVINPITNRIYVTNRKDNTVSVIDGASDTVIATIPVGSHPIGADVNLVTNKIYVANSGNDFNNTVSVIDGATNTVTATITIGWSPNVVAVNPLTNQIYAVGYCGNDPNGCQSDGSGANGTVSVINGATNLVTNTVNVGIGPGVLALNNLTNKIYVGNACGTDPSCLGVSNANSIGTVTVIDGVTLATATVNVGKGSTGMAVNPVANQYLHFRQHRQYGHLHRWRDPRYINRPGWAGPRRRRSQSGYK